MAVDYTKATPVNVDDGVYSQDYNRLALAFNDRLKNGVGDPTWRLLWYAHSLVRGMRNPSGFLYAAEDEWWKVYSHNKEASGLQHYLELLVEQLLSCLVIYLEKINEKQK